METTTPFDLNQAIQRWRTNLGRFPAFRSENLDEMESHLRDSIVALQAGGLSAPEAFSIAIHRIGKINSLEAEFGKINGKDVWLDRVMWMLIGIQVWGLVSSFTGSIARNALVYGMNSSHLKWREGDLALPVTLLVLAQTMAVVASVWICWWLLTRKSGNWGAWLWNRLQKRSTFTVSCGALCLLSLLIYGFGMVLQFSLYRSITTESMSTVAVCSNYSQMIVWPLQIVGMIAVTLFLARKSLRLTQAR